MGRAGQSDEVDRSISARASQDIDGAMGFQLLTDRLFPAISPANASAATSAPERETSESRERHSCLSVPRPDLRARVFSPGSVRAVSLPHPGECPSCLPRGGSLKHGSQTATDFANAQSTRRQLRVKKNSTLNLFNTRELTGSRRSTCNQRCGRVGQTKGSQGA